ncbi:hypothetical protein J4Q44_G00324730 [Coregonus suidteri]|uniref:Uncharacterized protein n=1 Tax=Coregonus suidteri TaxID=861788 RepID=A0AAN8QAR2_9TELE
MDGRHWQTSCLAEVGGMDMVAAILFSVGWWAGSGGSILVLMGLVGWIGWQPSCFDGVTGMDSVATILSYSCSVAS